MRRVVQGGELITISGDETNTHSWSEAMAVCVQRNATLFRTTGDGDSNFASLIAPVLRSYTDILGNDLLVWTQSCSTNDTTCGAWLVNRDMKTQVYNSSIEMSERTDSLLVLCTQGKHSKSFKGSPMRQHIGYFYFIEVVFNPLVPSCDMPYHKIGQGTSLWFMQRYFLATEWFS